MSEPAGPTPVATQTRGRADGGAPEREAPRRRRFRRSRARQARVVIRKVGPWSVLKFSVLFYLCIMTVILGALVILYEILGAIGALDSVTRLIRDLFADQTFEIDGNWLFTRGLMVGLAMVVLWSLINVFVAFLYNLISDIVGGIEVTLSERR
jgi:hypothetical protein